MCLEVFLEKKRGMKKISILFVLLLMVITSAAQRQTEYNRKGDEALRNLDYSSAKMWYEDGVVSNCDSYSISQLTSIWLAEESMHASMRSVMNKCLGCLEDRATRDRDTTSMNLLIKYYEEGIGTYSDEAKVEFWQTQLNTYRNPYQAQPERKIKQPREKVKMNFFAGYSGSYYAPVGLTVGSVSRIGWYLRFRTNMSFQDYTEICDKEGNIVGELGNVRPSPLKEDKVNMWAATGGMMFRIAPSFYLSVGGGYCQREALYKFDKIGIIEAKSEGTFWAKCNDDTSFDGVALDLDGTFRIGKTFYGSLGCSMFHFKYVSANAGIGVFF